MLAAHRTQERIQAQQLDSSPGISRRSPDVTYEESRIIHIAPPASLGMRPEDP